MKRVLYPLCFLFTVIVPHHADAQGFLRKIKDKVNQTVNNAIDKKTGTSSGNEPGNTNNNGKPSNKGGGGLSNTTPPDVKAQMTEAESAHAAKNYSDARYSLQQALIGVEVQLGRQILKSLPASVDGLNVDTAQDIVMSTQWGWNNLSIQRVWKKNDKHLTMTVGNAGIYAGLANLYFTNAGITEASNTRQNIKQVRVKGNKAIIQYENSDGYTLLVSLGQSSMIVWGCINFANEQEVMNTADKFDINGIKKMLGEQ